MQYTDFLWNQVQRQTEKKWDDQRILNTDWIFAGIKEITVNFSNMIMMFTFLNNRLYIFNALTEYLRMQWMIWYPGFASKEPHFRKRVGSNIHGTEMTIHWS